MKWEGYWKINCLPVNFATSVTRRCRWILSGQPIVYRARTFPTRLPSNNSDGRITYLHDKTCYLMLERDKNSRPLHQWCVVWERTTDIGHTSNVRTNTLTVTTKTSNENVLSNLTKNRLTRDHTTPTAKISLFLRHPYAIQNSHLRVKRVQESRWEVDIHAFRHIAYHPFLRLL